MSLADKLNKARGAAPIPKRRKRETPVWAGPESDAPNGGITFSLLSRFLVCRERFRLLVVEGLKPAERFNHRIEYGQMWHVCEEALAGAEGAGIDFSPALFQMPLQNYCRDLTRRYPLQQRDVIKWYEICRRQFPLYVDYWAQHSDVRNREPLLQEQVFNVSYSLPSGRTVRLRGKWDSVDLIRDGKRVGVWLQENKTKGDIREDQIARQLTFDLQTMTYLIALERYDWTKNRDVLTDPIFNVFKAKSPILGVRYNVVRRPLSGGKGSIVQRKGTKNVPAETDAEYYDRMSQYIKDEPQTYFMRWQVPVTEADVSKFRREYLDPILEQLCNWWDWISEWYSSESKQNVYSLFDNSIHWRHPFGVYNVLDEGGATELDEYLANGSEAGLTRTDKLFPEL